MHFPLRPHLRSVAAGVALAVLAAGRGAAASDGAPPLVVTRATALELGAQESPGVREARAPIASIPAIRDRADELLPYAPRLTASAGRRQGAFGSGLEIGGGVMQEFSLRGLGGARRDTAAALEQSATTQLERAKLEGGAHAVLAWLDVLEAQQIMALRGRSRADAEEIARVARARVDRGAAMPIEGALASAEVGGALLAERDAEGRLVEARMELLFALGLPPSRALRAEGDLDSDDDAAQVRAPRREHPAHVAARAQAALARADAKLARAHASPTVGLGVNYMREGTGEQLVTGTLSLPLPVFDPARFEGARFEAHVLTAEAHARRVHDELMRDEALHAHDREHMRDVRDTLRDRVLVPLRETVRQARANYLAGTQDATSLLVLRQRLVLAEEQLAHAGAEVKRADVRYELARGTLLDEGVR